jgi:hypothetical protein
MIETSRPLPAGVSASPDGTCTLSGAALRWLTALDAHLAGVAAALGCLEVAFPPVIAARELARIDYFRSFPHLVTVPVSYPADETALRRVAEGEEVDPAGTLRLREHAPVGHALTPAACYPVYAALGGTEPATAHLVTTRATCYRREERFVPLRRMWAFSMREIVCVGDDVEVGAALAAGTGIVDDLLDRLGLAGRWQDACDPFFQPARNGRALLQLLAPVKREMVVDGLAIASVNTHHDHFGSAFEIRRHGRAAASGCVAFGLERWLGVVAGVWGPDPVRWPDPAGR